MPPHPLTNFETQRFYQNVPKLNGVYWRNDSCKIKDEVCVMNFDKYKSVGTDWISSYVRNNVYVLIVLVLNIFLKRSKKLVGNKINEGNIYGIQSYDWIKFGYFSIGLIDFMLNKKRLAELTNLFSPNIFFWK